VGLMRLALTDGDTAKATELLSRAVASAGDDPRADVERALLSMMKSDLALAKETLVKVTNADRGNLQAWSLLAAITMQQIDQSKDAAEREKLEAYLAGVVLPTMEKQARSSTDYHLLMTRAFVLMHKKGDNRVAARDAFAAAAESRPDIGVTGDIVLELDISLGDAKDAEMRAREILRRNRRAPYANYVMGSLALEGGRYLEAETFLRRAVEAPRPSPLALNDLAEVLCRNKNFADAEKYARKAVAAAPGFYLVWETLGTTIMDAGGNLDEAEQCITKACELSKGPDGKDSDVRMLISLARVQIARGDMLAGKTTLYKVKSRIGDLSEFDRKTFEELRKSAK